MGFECYLSVAETQKQLKTDFNQLRSAFELNSIPICIQFYTLYTRKPYQIFHYVINICSIYRFNTYILIACTMKVYLISDNYRNKFQSIQTFHMKVLQCSSPKSHKLSKRISLADPSHLKSRETQRNENNQYLSPMHIKLQKNKLKDKKQNKHLKPQNNLPSKRTKRKQTKQSNLELNSTIVVPDSLERKNTKRQGETYTKLKTKTTEKTFRQTFKSQQRKLTNNQWFLDLEQKSTVADLTQKKKRKNRVTKQDLPLSMNQEYLFIGDQFFLVNNLNPTKRLLNTFRQNCKKDQPQSKFIAQDKNDRLKTKLLEKKTNIFTQTRKQLELNYKIKKAIKIQRWWRKFLGTNNVVKDKSQFVKPLNQQLSKTQPKLSFKKSEQSSKHSLFQTEPFSTSPIINKRPNFQEALIVSFNSAERIEESKPKKISFTKEDITKLITPAYKLPQIEVNADENEDVFNICTKFRVQQANIFDTSSDNLSEASQKQQISPQKVRQNHFQSKINEQWSPKKVADPRYEILKQFQEATKIKQQIQFRTAFQKGLIKPLDTYNSKVGISTSILAIHTFLVKFFNFYIQKYQDQFISLINMPYGYSVPARLRDLQGYGLPQEIEEDDQGVIFGVQEIIDDQKLEEFYFAQAKQGKNITNFTKANLQLQKIHNKSVIDLFNQLLNQYRPYKQINGVPYPWNHSYKALTFYFVTEDNIAQVFEKVQIKILKDSSILSGIMLPIDETPANLSNKKDFDTNQFMQNYHQNFHPMLFQYNQQKQLKSTQQEVKSQPFECSNQDFTKVLIQLSNQILYQMALQYAQQLHFIKKRHQY